MIHICKLLVSLTLQKWVHTGKHREFQSKNLIDLNFSFRGALENFYVKELYLKKETDAERYLHVINESFQATYCLRVDVKWACTLDSLFKLWCTKNALLGRIIQFWSCVTININKTNGLKGLKQSVLVCSNIKAHIIFKYNIHNYENNYHKNISLHNR